MYEAEVNSKCIYLVRLVGFRNMLFFISHVCIFSTSELFLPIYDVRIDSVGKWLQNSILYLSCKINVCIYLDYNIQIIYLHYIVYEK